MTSYTTKYGLPYPDGTDAVMDGDNTMAALAARMDLMLGETGTTTITPTAADTTFSQRVNYSRSYATVAANGVPTVMVAENDARAVSSTVWVWTSGEDATGFTLNIRAVNTNARPVTWICRPKG